MVARLCVRCVVTVLGSILMIGCLCGECSEALANKELVATVFEVVESGDLDRLDEYIANDYVRHCQATPDVEVASLAAFKEFLVSERETVPNPKLVHHRLVAEDDLVAFWATYSGAEVDLFFIHHGRRYGIECKFSETPKTTRSMNQAIESLNLAHLWIIYPGEYAYPLSKRISVWPTKNILTLPEQLR